LKGITTHKFENETQNFSVTFNSKKISKEQIIKAVESAESDFTVINWQFHKTTK
jgi:copper chaperone CopZ